MPASSSSISPGGSRWWAIMLPLPPILVGLGLFLSGYAVLQAIGVALILLGLYVPIHQYRSIVKEGSDLVARSRPNEREDAVAQYNRAQDLIRTLLASPDLTPQERHKLREDAAALQRARGQAPQNAERESHKTAD